ncbi:MAG: hypothetical protein WDO71_03035 [Bacteroidota bacterium]
MHIQVYFYAKPYKHGYDQFDMLKSDITTDNNILHRIINSDKYKQPLFFGWNKKQNIVQYVNTLKPNTWSFEKTSRVYWRCPIKEAFTMPQLIEYINCN